MRNRPGPGATLAVNIVRYTFFVRGINTTSFHVVFLIEGHFYMHKIIYSMLRTAPNRIPIFSPPLIFGGGRLRSTELKVPVLTPPKTPLRDLRW